MEAIFFFLGCLLGVIIIGSALFASFGEDNDHWRKKG